MIPEAEATGRCEIRPNSYVRKVETDAAGRVTGVKYFDAKRREVFQRARAVVLCANGAETPRLLLMSKSNRFPHGLANASGMVGRQLMFNCGAFAGGLFPGAINGYRGVVDYPSDPRHLRARPEAWAPRRRWIRFPLGPAADRVCALGPGRALAALGA